MGRYLIAQANTAKREVQKLNQQKHALVAAGADRDKVMDLDNKITTVMTRLNQAVTQQQARQ